MGQFIKGDLVVIPFPFSDLSGAKRRPAMVVAPLPGDDVILCQVTSVDRDDQTAVAINASDLEAGSLSRVSYIRPSRLFTADSTLILYRAGHLNKTVTEIVIKRIVSLIRGG